MNKFPIENGKVAELTEFFFNIFSRIILFSNELQEFAGKYFLIKVFFFPHLNFEFFRYRFDHKLVKIFNYENSKKLKKKIK